MYDDLIAIYDWYHYYVKLFFNISRFGYSLSHFGYWLTGLQLIMKSNKNHSHHHVCLGLTSLLDTWGNNTTVRACSSGTLTNVLPHRIAMPQTQDITPHPITVYRHGADLALHYPLMWNVTLEYTTTHFNGLGETRPGNPTPTFHTHQRTLNLMLLWW